MAHAPASFAPAGGKPAGRIVLGGVLDRAGGDFYIERHQDIHLVDLMRRGTDCVITGPRQVGKSSLANNICQLLRESGEFRYAWFDFDVDAEKGMSLEAVRQSIVRTIASQLDVDVDEGSSLAGAFQAFTKTGPPLIVVLDELDAIRRFERHGGPVIPELRALMATRKTRDSLRGRFVFVFISCRSLRMLYNLEDRGGATTPFELPGVEPVRLGRFDATDSTRRQLARAFQEHDPDGADNLALTVLEEAGGFPQLTMALTTRIIETGRRKDLDRDSFIREEVAYWKGASSDRNEFLETPGRFFADPSVNPRVGRDAILVYQELLREGSVEWDPEAEHHLLLESSGLAVVEDGRVRTRGRFLNEYYNLRWATEVRGQLEARLSARSPLEGRPKICVLVTGGTIGMVERDGRVRPPHSSEELRDEYNQVNARFDTEWSHIADLDSANIGPRHWGEFSRSIYERVLSDKFDGIVVAHGTDTLAFTASAVAYALGGNLDRPVVFTGSQTTVDVAHGDARSNILRACIVAAAERLPEVVIAFDDLVLRAVRAVKRDDRRFDAFESPFYPPLGSIAETVELQETLIRHTPSLAGPIEFQPGFVDGILVVSQVPGLHSAFYEAAIERQDPPVRGVVLQTLGAGNVPDRAEYDLTRFIHKTIDRGIPVLLSSQYPVHPANLGRYLTSEAALAAGAIPMANMTMAALVAKFSWVLARLESTDLSTEALLAQIRRYMWADLVGELDPRDYEILGKAGRTSR